MEAIFDMDVFCEECNEKIGGYFHGGDVYAVPCEKCLDAAREEGRQEEKDRVEQESG